MKTILISAFTKWLTNFMDEPLYPNVWQGQKLSDLHLLIYKWLAEVSCAVKDNS